MISCKETYKILLLVQNFNNLMNTLSDLLSSSKTFLEQLITQLKASEIAVDDLPLDHICYRVETEARYQELKMALSEISTILAETPINGRPITTFRLQEPIIFEDRKIELLELPCPKPNNRYKEGFEHVEFVIKEPFKDFMSRYAHLTFDTKGMNKAVNADIRLALGDYSVKFHHYPLDYVIEYLD